MSAPPRPPPPRFCRPPALLLLAALLGLGAIAGCAGPHQPPRQQQQHSPQLEALSAGAYRSAETGSLGLALQQWVLRGESLPVSLAYPVGGRGLPLVVYLPGLGEGAQAGAQWRQAWARAGYAVLSLQPLEADARAWSSELARAADFKNLARQHQQPALLAPRLRMLEAALAEARRRAGADDALWSRVDFERLAVVGQDLGSMAALQWGGAQLGDAAAASAATALPRPRALILLSPLVRVEEPGPLAGLGVPVLSISSREDSDPAGLLAAAAERVQSFELMPPGDKRLLLLENGRHALFAGTPGLAPLDEDMPLAAGRAAGPQRDGGRGRQQQPQQPRQQRGGPAEGGGAMPGARGVGGDNAQAQLAIERISGAFLDAHLRGDAAARAWLDDAAGPWLRGLAQWRSR